MYFYSFGIKSAINEKLGKKHDGSQPAAPCTACEMAVVLIQNQLNYNKKEEEIMNYVNEVIFRVS